MADNILPIDEGRTAYLAKRLMSDNPYQESQWQYGEWELGWTMAEETDSDRAFDWKTGAVNYSQLKQRASKKTA